MFKAIKNNLYILKLIHKADKNRIILTFIYHAWHATVDLIFGSLLLRFIINSYNSNISFSVVSFILGMLLISQIGYSFFSNYFKNIYLPVSNLKINRYVISEFFINITEFPLSSFDNPEEYNKFEHVYSVAQNKCIETLDNIVTIFTNFTSLFILSIVFLKIDIFICLIALIPVNINVVFSKKMSTSIYKCDLEILFEKRKLGYFNRVFFIKDYAKEIKTSNIQEVLFKDLDKSTDKIVETKKKHGKNMIKYKTMIFIAGEIGCFFLAVIYSYISYTFFSFISLGDMIYIITSLNKYIKIIIQSVNSVFDFYSRSTYIDDFKSFFNYRKYAATKRISPIDFESLYINDISYSYNSSKEKAVDSVSLSINKKKSIAIVGENGSGKSTFINLILGLYFPQSGSIRVNGKIDIQCIERSDYTNLFSCVFQDYKMFSCTIAENILGREVRNEDDERMVWEAIKFSGLYEDFEKNNYSIYDILTKEFDDNGVVLSGGQMQKLAIARAFFSNAPIIILDEPTSAMDPISEYNFFNKIKKLCEEKTIIYVTHHISSAVLADNIYLFEQGKILESGSHTQLMKLNGKYAKMFSLQEKQYSQDIGDKQR